jgi:general secretion pathway protein G
MASFVPRQGPSPEERRQGGTQMDIAVLKTALDLFKTEVGRYPTTAEGLAALVTNTINNPNWRGPYLEQVPND